MAENQEQIESRLCGYVDETLDSTEKAEIEAHLQAHPQHRQLLAELRQMRAALRDLPRESAPAELSESFTGQLERSVLLDGIGQQAAEPRMRITRMPQLAAIAAIVLLAVGLGFIIYFVALPGAKPPIAQTTHWPPSPPEVDSGTGPAIQPAESPVVGGDRDHVAQGSPAGGSGSPHVAAVARSGNAIDGPAPSPIANAEDTPQMAAVADSALSNHMVRSLLGRGGQVDQMQARVSRPTLVMVVATADPEVATRKLSDYLETNNADWQPASSPETVATSNAPTFGNASGRNEAANLGGAKNTMAAAPGAPLEDKKRLLNATQPETMPDALASAGAAANPPTTGPFGVQQQSQLAINGEPGSAREKAFKDAQEQLAGNANRLYVVRNLSYQQAEAISELLRQSGGGGAQTQAPLFAAKPGDDAYFAAKSALQDLKRQQQAMLAPAADATGPTTKPTTRPEAMGLTPKVGEHQALDDNAMPQTNPAGPSAGVTPVDNQSLLGSSPVDLVIVIQPAAAIQSAAAPTTVPAIVPATAPSTEPATQPDEKE